MEKRELVFVPAPGYGHLVSTVELAKRLIEREPNRISITVLTIKPLFAQHINTYIDSLSSNFPGIRFVDLPPVDPPKISDGISPETFISLFFESYKPHVKDAITQLISSSSSEPIRLAGLVIDLFFTTIIDVGNELGVPTFVFFTSNASLLGFMLHIPILHTQLTAEFPDSETELTLPSYAHPVPPSVFPSAVLNKKDDAYHWYLYHGRRFREAKGIIVNTFQELERYSLDSLVNGRTPPVYPVGPLLDLEGKSRFEANRTQQEKIMKWLDSQAPASVVLLCFGSMGSFDAAQVREIAFGLERSGHRFLWSLRNPTWFEGGGQVEDPREWLPEGFEERMEGKGVVVGEWLAQVEVLGHEAIGGFVSHCGWNSVLESLWFGVPVACWPLYAEQQLNAFLMVKELGLAVEIRMDYRMGGGAGAGAQLVKAEEVERGVREVMESESEVRKRVGEMKEKGRNALINGGSSYESLGRLIEDLSS